METETPRRSWQLLGAFWGVYAAFGLVAGSLAPVLTRLRDDLVIGSAALGLALGAWQFVYLFTSVPAGKLLDRCGLWAGVACGAAVIVVSGVLRAAAQGPVTLWLAVAVLGIGGPFISVGAAQLAASRFAAHHRSTAVGIYTTAPAMGSMFALLTAEHVWLPMFGSWRGVQIAAASSAAVAFVVWVVVARPRADDPASAAATNAPAFALLGHPSVRWVMAFTAGAFFFGHALNNWLPAILIDGGWSEGAATTLVGLGVPLGLVGSLTIPRRVRSDSPAGALSILFLACAVVLALVMVDVVAVQVLGVLGLGVLRVTLVPVAMLLLMSLSDVPVERIGAAGGLFFVAGEIGGVLGPLIVGTLRQATGSYTSAIWLIVGSMAVLSAAASMRPVRVARGPEAPN